MKTSHCSTRIMMLNKKTATVSSSVCLSLLLGGQSVGWNSNKISVCPFALTPQCLKLSCWHLDSVGSGGLRIDYCFCVTNGQTVSQVQLHYHWLSLRRS